MENKPNLFSESLELIRHYENIEMTPNTCGGVPRISGRRITVENIIGYLINNSSITEICQEYELNKNEIADAIRFTKELSMSLVSEDLDGIEAVLECLEKEIPFIDISKRLSISEEEVKNKISIMKEILENIEEVVTISSEMLTDIVRDYITGLNKEDIMLKYSFTQNQVKTVIEDLTTSFKYTIPLNIDFRFEDLVAYFNGELTETIILLPDRDIDLSDFTMSKKERDDFDDGHCV